MLKHCSHLQGLIQENKEKKRLIFVTEESHDIIPNSRNRQTNTVIKDRVKAQIVELNFPDSLNTKR
jgi:hypothetical protein